MVKEDVDKEAAHTAHKRQSWLSGAALSGGCAVVSAATKDAIFYSIDSYKVMRQAGQRIEVNKLFRGTVPIAVLGSGLSFGAFFVCYTPICNVLRDALGSDNESAVVFVASCISAVPSSITGVPADVIKKRLVLGSFHEHSASVSSIRSVASQIRKSSGPRGFFLGWKVNVVRDIPYASLKMSLYEGLSRLYLSIFRNHENTTDKYNNKLHGAEAAAMGFSSGVLAAFITCPIDCVNTRIKSGEFAHTTMRGAYLEIWRKDGHTAFFRGVVPRCAILAMGSTVFWYIQASLLNALS